MKDYTKAIDMAVKFMQSPGIEGFHTKAYMDANGHYSIGYGSQRDTHGNYFHKGFTCTHDEAVQYMKHEIVTKCIPAIEKYIRRTLTDGQTAALISFTYNLGPGGLQSSSVRKLINIRAPSKLVVFALKRYTKSGGKVLGGLKVRRQGEAALYLS